MLGTLYRLYGRIPTPIRRRARHVLDAIRGLMPHRKVVAIGNGAVRFRMVLDMADAAAWVYWLARDRYEAAERAAFLALLAHYPGAVVMDLGASYGIYTLTALVRTPPGHLQQVIAFEPDERVADCLTAAIERNRPQNRWNVVRAAAGDREGSTGLFRNARSSADNRTHHVTQSRDFTQPAIVVDMVTADDTVAKWCSQASERGYVVVKIDVQGGEASALRGMQRTLENAKGWAIFFEYGPSYLTSSLASPQAFRAGLAKLAPQSCYRVEKREQGLTRFPNVDALIADMETLDGTEECTDYVILREMMMPTGDWLVD